MLRQCESREQVGDPLAPRPTSASREKPLEAECREPGRCELGDEVELGGHPRQLEERELHQEWVQGQRFTDGEQPPLAPPRRIGTPRGTFEVRELGL